MILGIETATDLCGVALVHHQKVVVQLSVVEKNIHSEKLLPMIDELFRTASVKPNDVDGIAVSIGPGSFTGLRIGLSTAKGLALALGKPIIPVPTLDTLAHEYMRVTAGAKKTTVCALVDAKRGEAFYCFYSVDRQGFRLNSEYGIASSAKIIEEALTYEQVVFVGDAGRKIEIAGGMTGALRYMPEITYTPSAVAMIAEKDGKQLSAEDFSILEPMYIREFVATSPGRKDTVDARPGKSVRHTIAHSFEG